MSCDADAKLVKIHICVWSIYTTWNLQTETGHKQSLDEFWIPWKIPDEINYWNFKFDLMVIFISIPIQFFIGT